MSIKVPLPAPHRRTEKRGGICTDVGAPGVLELRRVRTVRQ
jgi:hypothetical protein